MFTRRRFLVSLPAFAASVRAFAAWPTRKKKVVPSTPIHVYFGTDTTKGVSKGIYQSTFDPTKGQLTPPVLAAATVRPSFLAISPPGPGRRSVYAANAINDPAATVTTFTLDPATGSLRQVGQVSSGGAGPAYISVDSTGHAAFVANYFGSSIASYRIQPDGTLSQPVDRLDLKTIKNSALSAPSPPVRTSPTPTVSPSHPTTASCSSVISVPTASASYTSTPRPANSPIHISSPTTVPAVARAMLSFTPTAAGSTASTKSTQRSTAAFGLPRASAPPRKAS